SSSAPISSPCASLFHPLFFLSLLPPPPRSPLFPYTTLFRSVFTAVIRARGSLCVRAQNRHVARLAARPDVAGLIDSGDLVPVGRDRKSTRLNSSHVSISYAVFCLKKKTKK